MRTLVLVITTVVLVAPTALQGQTAAYLDFDDLTSELRSLVNGSSAATMRSIGSSGEGREIWLIEIANPSGTPVAERPGLLVVGNLEGDHVVGSQLALETVRYLLLSDEADLDNQVFYVVPRLNPDGAEAMFAAVKYDRRRNAMPYDDDNDGRVDEDPPEDLNGDGMITVMRVPDASGAYLQDPDDPRLVKEADPAEGETGGYTLYWEGRDNDGDGFLNEDGPGGVDLNRNFQHVYPYWEADAGRYMVSEPESRAIMDFMIANRHIGAIITYGHSDNLVTTPDSHGNLADPNILSLHAAADAANADIVAQGVFGGGGSGGFRVGGRGLPGAVPQLRGAQPGSDNDPQSGRRPAETVNKEDLSYFEAVSDAYKEITGIEKIGYNRVAEGAFFQWGYYQFGVPSFSTQGWAVPELEVDEEDEEGEEPAHRDRDQDSGGGGFEATLLEALEGAGIDAFVDWTPFDHPDLGPVEIGGFRPYVTTNPPAADLPSLGRAHGEFTVRVASMLPRVRFADSEVINHGGGVFTISVTVENTGFFPTSLQHGVVSRAVQPTTVQIQVDPETILTGAAKSSTFRQLDGSGARMEFSWVIQAREGSTVEVRVRSQKGGTDSITVTLR